MSKEIVVNVGERETRIAVIEDGKLVELHIERAERVVGSLYKCRVSNVIQGMDAAFVDIGLDRNAFLAVGDVLPSTDLNTTAPNIEPVTMSRPNNRPAPNSNGNASNGRDYQGKRFGKDARPERDRKETPRPSPNLNSLPGVITTGQGETLFVDAIQKTEVDTDVLEPALFEASAENRSDPKLSSALEQSSEEEDAENIPASSTLETTMFETSMLEEESNSLANEDDDLDADEEDDDIDEDEDEDEDESSSESDAARQHRPMRAKTGFRRSMLRQQRITDVLKVGQEVLVQVIKGPRSTKGARVSTRISLPGRYLVLMPEADNLGVSRKIEDSKERDRLKKIGDKIRVSGFGLIIRTEAEDKTELELKADMDYLVQNWRQVQEKSQTTSAPALVLQDLTLLYKTIRDVFGSDVSKLVIDDPAEYEKANDLLDRISPKLKGRVHLYDGARPIFDEFNLETEIERLTRRKVFLRSGGSLVIDETEALTVIDVNSSKNVGGNSLAETIARTNVDAAGEIARQLRLRDIGGIIVIDFIDMNNPRDKQAVIKALETSLKKDRSRTKIANISPLGLVEMTRKRTGETLSGSTMDECPYCKGRGHLPSPESVSLLVERDLRRQVNVQQNLKKDAFLLRCHPEVAELIIGPEGATVEEMERQLERALFVRADEDAHIEAYTITPGEIGDFEKNKLNYRRAQIVECRIMRSLLKEGNKCVGWSDGYMLDLDDGSRFVGQKAKVRITDIRRSYAAGILVPGSNKPLDE